VLQKSFCLTDPRFSRLYTRRSNVDVGDHLTLQVLDRTVAKEEGSAMSARLADFDQKRTELTPGTVLVREWDRQSQRVMVMADGFAWNGQTYDSLSKVAFAITGTKWNGPRFFGLRDKEDRPAMEARP
jgi:hypothetical protein